MTDTVNKQKLLKWLDQFTAEVLARGTEDGEIVIDAVFEEIQSGRFDEPTPPTTPVQGYRAPRQENGEGGWTISVKYLQSIEDAIEKQEEHYDFGGLEGIQEVLLALEALSQTDIQPSKTTGPQQYHVMLYSHVKTFANEADAWVYFRKSHESGCEPTFFYGKDGINSTEDQPGPSISKCKDCGGTGVEPIHFYECRPCEGTGKVSTEEEETE